MSADDKTPKSKKMKGAFASGHAGIKETPLFTSRDFDIYVNRATLDIYFFHGKDVDYDSIDHLEYNHKTYTVDIIKKDKTRQDLGVKVQWLIRAYFSKAQQVNIVQTKDGETVKGTTVPLVHKTKK